MSISTDDIHQYAEDYAKKQPQEILKLAFEHYPNAAIAFSGAEDVVLIDMAAELKQGVRVFCLDTGRLHPETYRFIDKVRQHYGVAVETMFPKPDAVEELVRAKGLFSFYQDGHQECCGVRKVEPLRRKLGTLDAWITGQRRDQSPGTRTAVAVLEEDRGFGTKERRLMKFNPLANWTSDQVWQYIRDRQVPHNDLHVRGFISIGCEPCTRAVLPNEHERAGRWWWEEATKKECGLHAMNVKS